MTDKHTQAKNSLRWVSVAAKAALAIAMLAWIVRTVGAQRGAEGISDVMARLRWEWLAVALGVHLVGVTCNVVRWRVLLRGQGIRPSLSFLVGSLLIARFFGAVTPGGFTGFGGWRIYDVARHTGKVARATATIAVETIVGWLAFGSVVMLGSLFGARFLGSQGVLLVNASFAALIGVGVVFLARPALFASLSRVLPTNVRLRVQTLVSALQAYRGKPRLLGIAVLCAVGVHTTHFLIYVCTAQAVGASQVGVGEVFFGSAMQILAAMVPITPNGIGVRELTALSLYESVGVPGAVAVLIPMLGFAVEMSVSMLGAFFFLARRSGYSPVIEVEASDREEMLSAEVPEVPESSWPSVRRGASIGVSAGLVAGTLVGLVEAGVVVASGRTGGWVIAYGAVAYALFCAVVGGASGALLAWSGRAIKREAFAEPRAFSQLGAALVAGIGFGLTAFRVRRDVFEEQLRWASARGLGVLLGCALAAVVTYALLEFVLRQLASRRPFAMVLRPVAAAGAVALVTAALGGAAMALWPGETHAAPRTRPAAPSGAGNVLVVVVDTLRADHLPSYGYAAGRTPNLDAFAEDAIRFDQAFANASWTRPSFASILTGRYPSSHGVMAKGDALPEDLVTMGEAFGGAGYHTAGFVTNYNVGPYFHFDQGFDDYHYLAPEFVLWADDSAAKLLLVQFLRQRIESLRDAFLGVQPGTAYQDAATVNARLEGWLDHAPRSPFMLFVGYMDPHDPYFEHPYSGSGYARAAHPSPEPGEAEALTRLYDGEITYWDEHFGALLASLRRRGLYDDLTIVVTADHGEEFGEHGGFWHGTTLYDEQVHVPLFVKLPRARRGGTVVRHWVQSIDVMPTLLRGAGIVVPEGVQGGDLFEGTERVFAEESHEGNVLEAVRARRGTDEIKLITANEGNPRGLPAAELFRVDLDPGEQHDLSRSPEAGDARTHAERALSAARIQAAQGAVEGEEVELDAESRRQLCELGYLTGEACAH